MTLCIALGFGKTCNAFVPLMPSSLSLAETHFGRASGHDVYKRKLLSSQRMVSSGFSFSDGEKILVSLQKPLGILLEQDIQGPIVVAEVNQGGSADDAGVNVGDVLLAVQNASVESADLGEVLAFIGNAPRVINLRLLRKGNE
mmetsp:Transcript_17862/g.28892  ORF Transcript_17862/g.28892 Transcript_17862/m.28892 type:complete len:143 (+) Transcript_17862:2-430(+)